MKLDRIAALLFGLISTIGVIYTIYSGVTNPSPSLSAYISSAQFYTPPQYRSQMATIESEANWNGIYPLVESVAKDALYIDKKAVVNNIYQKIKQPWAPPFEEGLEEFRTTFYISIVNSGSVVAKDVYIDLPDNALLEIEDDKEELSATNGLVKRYLISSIKQNGKYRIWGWTKQSSVKFNEYAIQIGNEKQVAKIEYAEQFSGIASIFAENYKLILYLILFTTAAFFYLAYETLKSYINELRASPNS